jgi:hypothetical protein
VAHGDFNARTIFQIWDCEQGSKMVQRIFLPAVSIELYIPGPLLLQGVEEENLSSAPKNYDLK